MATAAVVNVKIADMEPVRGLLDSLALAVAEFVKLSDEEREALPEPARAGIGLLLDVARELIDN